MSGPGCGHGVVGIGLPRAPATLAVGPVNLDDGDVAPQQMAGEPGPVAAGPFHTDELNGPETLEPVQQFPIASGGGRKALDAKLGSSFVEGGRHVGVEVCVDPSGDSARDSGHRHLFLSLGWVTGTSKTMDRTAMGLCGRLL